MSAGKSIAPGGPQQDCQLTGWAAPDLTAISPDELPNRAATPNALLNQASIVNCCLANPHPPPLFSQKIHQSLRMALGPVRLGAQPTANVTVRSTASGSPRLPYWQGVTQAVLFFNPIVVELGHVFTVLNADKGQV